MIVLHIDRLVLRGVDPGDTADFAQALAAALRERIAAAGRAGLAAAGHRHLLRTGLLRIAPDADGAALGRAIAGPVADRIAGRPAGARP